MNTFTADGGPHNVKRIRAVADGLRRIQEFESAEMLTAYADSIERAQAHAELYKSACDSVEEWKARALKAERIVERLGDSLNDMTGPTFMGEPVLSRPVMQGEAVQLEAAIKRAARKNHG